MHAGLLEKRLWCKCFPVDFTKLSRTPFLLNTSGRLLLPITESFFMDTCVLFIALLETWMFIQYSIDFHFWAVAKYNSD